MFTDIAFLLLFLGGLKLIAEAPERRGNREAQMLCAGGGVLLWIFAASIVVSAVLGPKWSLWDRVMGFWLH